MLALERCHCVVLAAGKGTRMGGPKALMPIAGKAWWVRQSARLSAMGIASTWVVSEGVRGEMQREKSAPPRLVVSDPDAPMFTSVLEGLRSLVCLPPEEREGVFIHPVDGPVPGRDVWLRLADVGGVAVPAHGAKRGHPLLLDWTWIEKALGELISTRRDSGELRLDRLIAPVVVDVDVADPLVTVNLNRPEDIASFEALYLAEFGGAM